MQNVTNVELLETNSELREINSELWEINRIVINKLRTAKLKCGIAIYKCRMWQM